MINGISEQVITKVLFINYIYAYKREFNINIKKKFSKKERFRDWISKKNILKSQIF